MKRTLILQLLMLFLILLGMGFMNKARITEVWSTSKDLKVPESVMYDKAKHILYVANINGKPTEKNNMGFISKISLDGKIVALKWVDGMNAPKGMGLKGNMLYVTDIDRIHVIDKNKGQIIKTHDVSGAKFLNDIAIDSKGNVYITDMLTKKVLILKNNKVATWIVLNEYSKPNGLFMEEPDLLVGTAGGLLRINLNRKDIKMKIPNKGGIDGLKKIRKDEYIVSDWKGKTQLIGKNKHPIVLLDTTDKKINAADLEYIPDKRLIIIPTFFDNRVVAYKLTY
jgi:hypothetical protein